MRATRTTAALAIAGLGLFSLSACFSPAHEVETEIEAPEETEASQPAPVTVEGQPWWALEVTTPGEVIASFTVGDVQIDVYQVDVVKATKTGSWATPDGDPIIDVGDDIVFVNYVISNTGAPIDLGFSLVNVTARYNDWPYLQGMDSIFDRDLFTQVGVHNDPFGPDTYIDPGIFTLGTGERYSFGENFPYQSGSPITFTAVITPVDADGRLVHDDRVEGEGAGVIK